MSTQERRPTLGDICQAGEALQKANRIAYSLAIAEDAPEEYRLCAEMLVSLQLRTERLAAGQAGEAEHE